jgi:hypothetical protein
MMKHYQMTEEERGRVAVAFNVQEVSPGQQKKQAAIRMFGEDFAGCVMAKCPRSRELSLALTKIEEAVFWANEAIARNEVEDAGSTAVAERTAT